MNPELLLNHFDRVSEAPDAIPRLRRFIRELAVRGKLVEQCSQDKPASELLSHFQTKQTRIAKNGRLREHGALPNKGNEEPFAVPANWAWISVGQIGVSRLGKMLDKAKNKGTLRRYLRNVNVRWFDFDLSDVFEMPFEEHELDEFALRTGDVLICEGGEPGRAAVWDQREENIYFQKAIHRVRFKAGVNPFFFVNAIRESADSGRLYTYFTGVGIKHFTGKGLSSFVFPLAPLAEQNRIVAKLDELMALCDRLAVTKAERETRRDRLSAASHYHLNNGADAEAFRKPATFYLSRLSQLTTRPDQIKQLRQTILNLAVRGQLVSQDRSDEPVSELLKRIQAEKARLLKSGAVRCVLPVSPVEPDRNPSAIPAGWEWVRVGDLLLGDSQNGYSRKPDDAVDGIPILRISAGTVRRDRVVAEEEHKLIGGVSAKHQDQYELQAGDLLACRFNGNRSFVGRFSLYVGYLGIKPIYPDKLIRLRLPPGFVVPKLIRCFAESSVVRKDIESYCATTVGNWGISASNLKMVKIPLPPLPEQHRIVAKVDELMALCNRLEAQLTSVQTDSSRLLEAVLHKAFANPAQ